MSNDADRPSVLLLEDEALEGRDRFVMQKTDGFELLGPCRNAAEAVAAMR